MEEQALKLGRPRQCVEGDRNVYERIVAVGRLPIDEPKTRPVEKDVTRNAVVMARKQSWRPSEIGFPHSLEMLRMLIENAGREQSGTPHMREKPPDDIRILDEIRKRGLTLQCADDLREGFHQPSRSARKQVERSLIDEIRDSNAVCFINVMYARSYAGRRGGLHGKILRWISQGAGCSLDAHKIRAPADSNAQWSSRCHSARHSA